MFIFLVLYYISSVCRLLNIYIAAVKLKESNTSIYLFNYSVKIFLFFIYNLCIFYSLYVIYMYYCFQIVCNIYVNNFCS